MPTTTLDSFLEELSKDREFAEELAETKPLRDLALTLIQIRKTLGITQTEFARRAGVTQGYIAQLESGTTNPSIRKVSSLMRKNGIRLRLEPTFFMGPDEPEIEQRTLATVGSTDLNEGEYFHFLATANGMARAIHRARVDQEP